MALIKFWICEQERRPRWVVRLDNEIYGDYLDKERALLDAIEAARDASAAGHEAEGLIDERSRVLTLVQRDEDRGVVSPAQYSIPWLRVTKWPATAPPRRHHLVSYRDVEELLAERGFVTKATCLNPAVA